MGVASKGPQELWFRRRRRAAAGAVCALFVVLLVLRWLAAPSDTPSVVLVLPVALAAMAFGLWAGLAAGLTGVGVLVVWAVSAGTVYSPIGWTARVLPLMLLGGLLGNASDRLLRAEAERRRVEAAALLYREAIEINDSLVQGMAAARWALESGRVEEGLKTLDVTIVQAQDLVSGLIRQAGLEDLAGLPNQVGTFGPAGDDGSASR